MNSLIDQFKGFFQNKSKRIFMDYASATPVLRVARAEMERYFGKAFYNSSAIYAEGVTVKGEIDEYRSRVAKALGAGKQDIVFTSGGTESVNLAILGAFEESREYFKIPHIIISSIEHPAVLKAAEEVVRRGGDMSIVPVDEQGLISLESLKKQIRSTTFMVSVGLANSEIGTVQPIARIGRLVREKRKLRKRVVSGQQVYPLLHTDASPAPSYIPVTLEGLQADLITLDGSKIYGPKGVGILAVRRRVKVRPTIVGGGQEGGRRAGTLPTTLVAGFTVALELAIKDREVEEKRLENLRKYFVETVVKNIPEAVINGSTDSHLPNIVSISIPNTLSEFLVLKLDKEGVLASVGTACSLDERTSGSPIIRAIGKPELAESTIRFSFGRFTTEQDVKKAVYIFCLAVRNMLK